MRTCSLSLIRCLTSTSITRPCSHTKIVVPKKLARSQARSKGWISFSSVSGSAIVSEGTPQHGCVQYNAEPSQSCQPNTAYHYSHVLNAHQSITASAPYSAKS